MPARDAIHNAVRNALEKDGWTITDDPLRLPFGGRTLFVLGAQRLIGAERGEERITVEIKSFSQRSEMANLEEAIGQYVLYRTALNRDQPDRTLYLAIPDDILNSLFREEIGIAVMQDVLTHIISVDTEAEQIRKWIP